MPDLYDAVVVGGRCAGAPVAMRLARAGHRVLLLDRARMNTDTVSTHHVKWPGLARLAAWGLLDRLRATGCPPLERLVYRVGDIELAGQIPVVNGIRAGYAPRRLVLDRLLVESAAEAGAEFRSGHTVTGLERRDGEPTTVHFRSGDYGTGRVRARLVVGADGMRSAVAGMVGAATEVEHEKMTCAYYGYWERLPTDFELFERPGRLVAAAPTHGDRTLVATYLRQSEFARFRTDPLAVFHETIRSTAPPLAQRMAGARQVEALRGTGNQWNVIRRAAGADWALVGDAACAKDSISGTGISDAFEQADLLADCVAGTVDDPENLAEALRGYASRHRALVEDAYQLALINARLEVTEERLAQVRQIRADPAAVEMFLAIGFGTVGVTPEHLSHSFRAGTA